MDSLGVRQILTCADEPKVISQVLGHATVAFTMHVYTEVAEELAEAAADLPPSARYLRLWYRDRVLKLLLAVLRSAASGDGPGCVMP